MKNTLHAALTALTAILPFCRYQMRVASLGARELIPEVIRAGYPGHITGEVQLTVEGFFVFVYPIHQDQSVRC